MSETQADYETANAADALRFEKAMIDESVEVVLRSIRHWQQVAGLDQNAWRVVVQRVFERIGEIGND